MSLVMFSTKSAIKPVNTREPPRIYKAYRHYTNTIRMIHITVRSSIMAQYMMLGRFTDKGMTGMDAAGIRIKKFKDLCEQQGAKVTSYHLLMGEYDVTCFLDAPNQDVIAKIALIAAIRGNVRTESMCAFTEDEFVNLVKQVTQ